MSEYGVFLFFIWSRLLTWVAPSPPPILYPSLFRLPQVASHTHYMPEHWVGKAHTLGVRKELLTMFHYKAQLFVEV